MSVRVIRGDVFAVDLPRFPLVIADPPYGKILREAWDLECYERLTGWLVDHLEDGGTAYVWGGIGTRRNRPFFRWLASVEESGLTLWDIITWSKKRAYGCKDRLLFTREECAMLVKGDEPRTFNIPLLTEKRGYAGYDPKYPAKSEYKRRTNVWTDVTEILRGKIHPAEKPSRLAEIMIETSSNPGDVVCDPFAGSGSTGVAADKLGRGCILVEKSDCVMYRTSEVAGFSMRSTIG